MIPMRDKNLNFIQFSNQMEKFIRNKLYFSKDRRTSVVDSPTLLEDYIIVYPRKFSEIRSLCSIVFFVPNENLRYRLILDLEDKITKFDLKKQLQLKLLLHSREISLKYLFETKTFTSNEIFGNIVNQGCKILINLKFIKRSTKVIKPIRKRGYDDKGSLRPREKWLESFDNDFTQLQNYKEKKFDLHQKTLQYLIIFLKES